MRSRAGDKGHFWQSPTWTVKRFNWLQSKETKLLLWFTETRGNSDLKFPDLFYKHFLQIHNTHMWFWMDKLPWILKLCVRYKSDPLTHNKTFDVPSEPEVPLSQSLKELKITVKKRKKKKIWTIASTQWYNLKVELKKIFVNIFFARFLDKMQFGNDKLKTHLLPLMSPTYCFAISGWHFFPKWKVKV